MKELNVEEINEITQAITSSAIEVHRTLGPGLLKSAYRECLAYELKQKGFDIKQEVPLPLKYKEVEIDCGYKLDILVNNAVIIEIKSVDNLNEMHEAQLLSYLKISGKKLGLLLNFNIKMLRYGGIKRIVNQ